MIFDERLCELGEGPMWHPTRHQLFWFDILGKRMLSQGTEWQFDTYVSAAGWVDESTLLVASADALLRFDITTGNQSIICPLEADNPNTRSNDGRADPQGGFWIGTMGLTEDSPVGAIYRYYKGELRQLFGQITIPNAICFAPDGTTAYFTDTLVQKIMQVGLDDDGWPNGAPSCLVDLSGTAYRPDGAVVDAEGNIWNAQWGTSRIAGYKPDGTLITALDFPAVQTSCPAFGGPDLTTLYCTSARIGQDGADDGRTFVMETDIKGQAEHRVIL